MNKRMRELQRSDIKTILCSVNSYTGLFKNKQQYYRLRRFINIVQTHFHFLEWCNAKQCFKLKQQYL